MIRGGRSGGGERQPLQAFTGDANSVLLRKLGGEAGAGLFYRRAGQEFAQFGGDAGGSIFIARDGTGGSESGNSAGVVGLVVAVGHEQRRNAGEEDLGGGPCPALMDDGCGVGEEPGIGRVVTNEDVGIGVFGLIASVAACEENGPNAQFFWRQERFPCRSHRPRGPRKIRG